MKDKIAAPEFAGRFNGLWALRAIKVSLLILLLGICVVGKRKSTWPIVSWALYSGYSARFRPPEPTVSVVELRAYTETGERYTIRPEQLLTLPRDSLSHKIVEQTFGGTDIAVRNASRRYLMDAVSDFVRANNIETIEAWQRAYPIEPLAVPPIKLQAPASEVMLGSFSKADIAENH